MINIHSGYTPNFFFKNRELFFFFVDICNKVYRHGDDLQYYKKIIEHHRQSDTLYVAELVEQIYETLKKWNMNQRGAKLAPQDDFEKSLLSDEVRKNLIRLNKYKLHDLYCLRDTSSIEKYFETLLEFKKKIEDPLSFIFNKINVMESKSKIVGVAKTLHFLLPDLIVPIDRKYTMDFFYGHSGYSANPEKEFHFFVHVVKGTLIIAKRLDLKEKDIDGIGWNTSVPKLIDNAIIGFDYYCRENFSKDRENTTNNVLSLIHSMAHIQDSEEPSYKKFIEDKIRRIEKEESYVKKQKEKNKKAKELLKELEEIHKVNPARIKELLESINSKKNYSKDEKM